MIKCSWSTGFVPSFSGSNHAYCFVVDVTSHSAGIIGQNCHLEPNISYLVKI